MPAIINNQFYSTRGAHASADVILHVTRSSYPSLRLIVTAYADALAWQTVRRETPCSERCRAATSLKLERLDMANTKAGMDRLMEIDGALGCCLVDSNSGMVLAQAGGGPAFNLEVAAAGNTEVVRAKRKTMKALDLKDSIEDIL